MPMYIENSTAILLQLQRVPSILRWIDIIKSLQYIWPFLYLIHSRKCFTRAALFCKNNRLCYNRIPFLFLLMTCLPNHKSQGRDCIQPMMALSRKWSCQRFGLTLIHRLIRACKGSLWADNGGILTNRWIKNDCKT